MGPRSDVSASAGIKGVNGACSICADAAGPLPTVKASLSAALTM